MASTPLLHQKPGSSILPQFSSDTSRPLYDHFHSTSLIFSTSFSTAPTVMKKSRISQGRIILVICITFMVMAIAHIHYIGVYHRQREAQKHNNNTPSLRRPITVITDPSLSTSTSEYNTTETELTSIIHYANGTITKVFKPAFYKDTQAARKEMGSFLDTLAKRTWWKHDADTTASTTTSKKNSSLSPSLPSDAFFGYLPMGGSNNQFTSLQRAAVLAKDLNRTLIIPPISPNSHIKVWAGPRYSEFYDLESFSARSGIPVLEWHDIKQTPDKPPKELTHHWTDFAEELPCIPNGGIGVDDKNLYDHFRPQFLMNFKAAEPEIGPDEMAGKATEYPYVRDVLLKDKDDNIDGKNGPRQMWKCLSCPYFLGGVDLSDRAWKEVGLHMRFNDKIEAMADQILDQLLPKPAKDLQANTATGTVTRRHPEFIIIHLRRGDIVNKCTPGQDEKDCLVQIEQIAEKVNEIEKNRQIKALAALKDKKDGEGNGVVLERLPVLVATNEKRPEELAKLDKLGWTMLDHGDIEYDEEGNEIVSKTRRLGTMNAFGPFYPPMLDAVLLTRGDYLIGMSNSRMSQLATQRGAAWYGHTTMLM